MKQHTANEGGSGPHIAAKTKKNATGFIGVGSMGEPMATRLTDAGFPLMVLDADRARAAAIAKTLGVVAAKNGTEIARASDIIITMLPTSDIVAAVLGGPEGVLAGLRPGSLVIEMSSGVPTVTRNLATLVEAKGGSLIDAPVSGGVPRARTGDLAIMAGGAEGDIARAEPLLRAMGSSIMRTGGVGTAHAMKALNNLVSAGGFLIGIEALLVAQRFGLDPSVAVDVLNASSGMNNSTQKKFKQFVLSRRFNAGFGLDLMVKDLSIALSLAQETGTPTPFAALCREMWSGARGLLGPGQDHTAVARLCETLAGSELHEM